MAKRRRGTCAYCGAEDVPTTKDHVPPKELFLSPRPDLITVPACRPCNESASADEEYFRICILGANRTFDDPRALTLWNNQVTRGLLRRPALLSRVIAQFGEAEVTTTSGLLVDKVPVMFIEQDRINRVVEKIVRGLYYHNVGKTLRADLPIKIRHETLNPENALNATISFWNSAKGEAIGGDAFAYRYRLAEQPEYSVWWMYFYKSVLITAITGVEQDGRAPAIPVEVDGA